MDTLVSTGAARTQYTATSLQDIAAFFDQLAHNSRTLAEHSTTLRERRFNAGAALAYKDAANILRGTTLKETGK